MAWIQSQEGFSNIVREALTLRKKEKQAEDMYRRLCSKNTGRIFQVRRNSY